MSENGEIYTAGKNFTLSPAVTAVTNLTSVNAIGPETYFTIKRLKKWSPNGHQVVTRWGVDLVYSLLTYLFQILILLVLCILPQVTNPQRQLAGAILPPHQCYASSRSGCVQ